MDQFRPQRRGVRPLWLIAVAALLSVTAGCGSDDEDPVVDTTTTTAVSTTTTDSDTMTTTVDDTTTTSESPDPASTTTTSVANPTDPDEQAVTDRYLAFWAARAEANANPPNPDHPRLADLATGAQLANVIAETTERRDQGLALRPASPSVAERHVEVISIDGDRAELNDCSVNDGVVYRVSDGSVVDDSVVTRNVAATMVRVDGQWRLESARVLQFWEGVAGCALADR